MRPKSVAVQREELSERIKPDVGRGEPDNAADDEGRRSRVDGLTRGRRAHSAAFTRTRPASIMAPLPAGPGSDHLTIDSLGFRRMHGEMAEWSKAHPC